jgi:hypothetical protein
MMEPTGNTIGKGALSVGALGLCLCGGVRGKLAQQRGRVVPEGWVRFECEG